MDDAADGVLGSPTYLLMKAGTLLHDLVDTTLAGHDLTGRQFLVLTHAVDHELSQRELSERLGLDPTLLVGVVDDLVEQGLVERHRDPRDRRRNVVRVTPSGASRRRDAARAVASLESEFFEPVPAAERRQIARTLVAVLEPHLSWLGPSSSGND